MDDFVAGKLEPSIKSEPVPKSQDGPVTIVVAKNYKEIVLDDKKDVLLEFYAPWCGHCKALSPKYDELGGLFKDQADKVVISKVDATANDVPEEIQGFPTIKLFPAGKKDEPIDYSGPRTVEDLAAFVRDNGSNKVDFKLPEADEEEGTESSASSKKGGASETMQHQAPAASKAKDAAKAAGEAAQKVVEATSGDDASVDDHDEL